MASEIITSPQNVRVQRLRRLSAESSRSEEWFLLEGGTLLEEAFSSGWDIDSLYYTDSVSLPETVSRYQISERLMRSITSLESAPTVIAIARKKLLPIEDIEPGRLSLLLDSVQDPGNVGTLLRSAAAFGAAAVLSTRGTVHFYNPKVVRASMGGMFKLQLCEQVTEKDVSVLLRRTGAELVVADSRAGAAPASISSAGCILALGHETEGVSPGLRKLASRGVRIPMRKTTESLNVAVAGSILLYEMARILQVAE